MVLWIILNLKNDCIPFLQGEVFQSSPCPVKKLLFMGFKTAALPLLWPQTTSTLMKTSANMR